MGAVIVWYLPAIASHLTSYLLLSSSQFPIFFDTKDYFLTFPISAYLE